MNGDDLLNIGAFAAATGLTIPALRHYDEIGLLKPAQIDPSTGYRRYRQDQVHDARTPWACRSTRFVRWWVGVLRRFGPRCTSTGPG